MLEDFFEHQQKIVDNISKTTKSWSHSKKVGSYLIGSTIGQGAFAKVKMGLHVYTARKVAVKIINKKTCIEDSYASKNMKREAKIWKKIDHRNVVKLLDVLETNNGYYLITELCSGSDLKSVINNRICGCLDEYESLVYLYDILSAVSYMHGLGIIHRDLKIDNILLDGKGNVKLIDFGLSCLDSSQSHRRTFCGSPAYAAPELLANQSYGKKVDVWSIGVNMYVMLTGNLPFTVHPFSVNSIYEKMTNQGMNVIEISISSDCRDLLLKLLAVEPDKRVTAEEALQHDWFSKISRKSRIENEMELTSQNKNDLYVIISKCLNVDLTEIKNKINDKTPSSPFSFYNLLIDSYKEFIENLNFK